MVNRGLAIPDECRASEKVDDKLAVNAKLAIEDWGQAPAFLWKLS